MEGVVYCDRQIMDYENSLASEMTMIDSKQRHETMFPPTAMSWERSTTPPRSSRLQMSVQLKTLMDLNTTTVGLNDLPDDILAHMACFLNVGSLKQARVVNRRFNRILSSDKAGWKEHLQRLWSRRVHVHLNEYLTKCAKDAYRLSCMDARLRHAVRLEELVFDPNNPVSHSTVWSFRFKYAAGAEWTRTDPWHQGDEGRRFVFLRDGHVRQLEFRANDAGEQEGYSLHQPFFDADNLAGGLVIRWRFVTQPIDFPKKDVGAYIRLTIAGRDVPTYIVHRSPLGNWSFILENCWGVFSSSSIPRKVMRADPAPPSPRMRLRRFSNGGARWLDVSQVESDDEDDYSEEYTRQLSKKHLLEDSSLAVTCRWQWREALLYNLGASTLPDGPNATSDFDRAWNLSMRSMQSYGFPAHHRGHDNTDERPPQGA